MLRKETKDIIMLPKLQEDGIGSESLEPEPLNRNAKIIIELRILQTKSKRNNS